MTRGTLKAREQAAPYRPSALVLDCSVALAWYLEGESTAFTDSLLHATRELEVWVPSLWVLEFANALLAAERRRRIDRTARAQIIDQASRLPINVDPHVLSLQQAGELSVLHDLTPYDAAYFELAQRRKLPLATLDAALVRAVRASGMNVITDQTLFP